MSEEQINYDSYFIRDEIKELINAYKFEIAKLVLIDENIDEQTQDDIILNSINEYISIDQLVHDEIEYILDQVEEACYKMAHFMHELKEE